MDPTEDFLKRHQPSADLSDEPTDVIPPTLYRIYKATVQRQVPTYRSLSSNAAFLILIDSETQVLGWVGSQCSEEDSQLLQELGIDVMTRDYGHPHTKSIPIVYEQDDANPLLEALLDIFEIDASVYSNKLTATERRKNIENSSVSIGIIIPPKNWKDLHLFELKETSYAHPDLNGMVPRIPFPHLEKSTIVYMNIGDQWDLWFSKNVNQSLVDLSIKFIENLIETQLARTLGVSLGDVNATGNITINSPPNANGDPNHTLSSLKTLVLQYLQITNQGDERQCFRRPLKIFTDFEPFEDVNAILANRQEQQDKFERETNTYHNNQKDLLVEHRPEDNLQIRREFTPRNANDMSPVIARDSTNFWASNPMKSSLYSTGKKSANPLYDENTDLNNRSVFAPPTKNLLLQCPTIQVNDVAAITPQLLEFIDTSNIPLQQRRIVVEESINNPDVLLGWQVSDHPHIIPVHSLE